MQSDAPSAQVVLEEGQPGAQQQVPLVVRGLTPSGYLAATDERGEQYELHPDGNRCGHATLRYILLVHCPFGHAKACTGSFSYVKLSLNTSGACGCSLDFFKGLIRKKIPS